MGSESPPLRRSLRIIAKQKLQEERQSSSSLSISKKPGTESNLPSPTENSARSRVKQSQGASNKTVEKDNVSKCDKTGESKKGKGDKKAEGVKSAKRDKSIELDKKNTNRKRKRTFSPSPPPSPPKKRVKKSPSNRGKKRIRKETQSSGQDTSEESESKEHSRKKQSKKGKEAKKETNTTEKGSDKNRKTVIVDPTNPSSAKNSSRNKKACTCHTGPEKLLGTASECPVCNLKISVSGRKGRGKGKEKPKERAKGGRDRGEIPKGKARSNWNSASTYSLPSLVEFARLTMASPE